MAVVQGLSGNRQSRGLCSGSTVVSWTDRRQCVRSSIAVGPITSTAAGAWPPLAPGDWLADWLLPWTARHVCQTPTGWLAGWLARPPAPHGGRGVDERALCVPRAYRVHLSSPNAPYSATANSPTGTMPLYRKEWEDRPSSAVLCS